MVVRFGFLGWITLPVKHFLSSINDILVAANFGFHNLSGTTTRTTTRVGRREHAEEATTAPPAAGDGARGGVDLCRDQRT